MRGDRGREGGKNRSVSSSVFRSHPTVGLFSSYFSPFNSFYFLLFFFLFFLLLLLFIPFLLSLLISFLFNVSASYSTIFQVFLCHFCSYSAILFSSVFFSVYIFYLLKSAVFPLFFPSAVNNQNFGITKKILLFFFLVHLNF